MLQGEVIDSKLQGKVKVTFLPSDQLQIGICCQEKYLTQSYKEMLKKLDLPSFEYRRRRGTIIEMIKLGYNHYDPN